MHKWMIDRFPVDAMRPDISLPLPPTSSLASAARDVFLRLRGPSFAEAQRVTLLGIAVAGGLIAARWLVVGWLRPWLVAAALALMAYLLLRTVVLGVLKRQQRDFEPLWLRVQSEVLAGAWFEVVRFTVDGGIHSPQARRGYDLTRPDDVRDLLARRSAERAAGHSSRACVEFLCSNGEPDRCGIETVFVDLADLAIDSRRGRLRFAEARFPGATYYGSPAPGRQGGYQPSLTTFWVLRDAVLTAVAPQS